ncbi:MAG: hypothetical protein IBX60_03065 [Candidatus Aminicenantes bacterium]|nr:hypothetical protein [Candidatus Aminicenantes bacterium]
MANRTLISMDGKSKLNTLFRIFGCVTLAFLIIVAGTTACKKGEEVSPEEGLAIKEGIVEFEGVVKTAVGKYLFIPEAKGFDIVVQGLDTSTLVDKRVKVQGEYSLDRPSILVANTIETKDEKGAWRNIYTRAEDVVLEDFISLTERENFPVLENLSYDKKDGWEEKGMAKVFGKLEEEAKEEGVTYTIVVLDEKGKQAGKIIVDNITDFGLFYMKKLRLYDKFWFYLNIKETVDWKIRRKTKEMFHADVLFAGLF